MVNKAAPVEEKTCQLTREQAAELGTSKSELIPSRLNSSVQGNGDESEGNERAGTPVTERRASLLSETFADFDARGVGLKMHENLSRDEVYQREGIPL